MTFSTQKRKIFSMWNGSNKSQFIIDDLSSNNQIILTKTNEINRTDMVYNNVVEFSSDWITPTYVLNKQTVNDPDQPDEIIELAGEHSVVFNGITTNLMPFISSKVVYRMGDGQLSIPIPFDREILNAGIRREFDESLGFNLFENFKINSIIEITPVVNEEGDEEQLGNTITYRTSLWMQFADVPELTGFPTELQLKFYVSMVNPAYYQST